MTKILVTGATGFIGRALCEALTREPTNCVVRHSQKLGSIQNIDFGLLPCADFDQIYHLASTTNLYSIDTAPTVDAEVIGLGTIKLLDNVTRFCPNASVVVVSSLATNSGQPTTLYGAAKQFAEHICDVYSLTKHLDIKIARLCNVYGVGEALDNMIKSPLMCILGKLLRGEAVEVYDEQSLREFLYIDDAVAALTTICSKGVNGESYDVGSGDVQVFKNLIVSAQQQIMSRSQITLVPPPKQHSRINVQRFSCCCKKIQALGWRATVTMEEGIRRIAGCHG